MATNGNSPVNLGNNAADVRGMADGAFSAVNNPQDVMSSPAAFLTGDAVLANNTPTMDANALGTNVSDDNQQIDPMGVNYNAATVNAEQSSVVTPTQAATFNADTVQADIAQSGQATAQTGTVDQDNLVQEQQIDTTAAGTGTNEVGKALNGFASQDISRVIDTSTVAGKLLAQELGEGNYTDSKATVQGQLAILSKQFTDTNGEPTIPSWAAGTARQVSRIAAFKGMTGSAATAAMSQAIMEATLPIAGQDAQFFQTMTAQNLSNRQQMTMNKAQVLANFEMANLDARMQAAVTNAQTFLQMDLTNLDNEQQTELVNTQTRVQAILEDSKAVNAERLFSAQSQNDFTQFYDQLNTQIDQFNTNQINSMGQFNAGAVNAARQFNSQIENQREQFYNEMQYNIDLSNARWRQTVENTNTQMQFQAAQQDVQNLFGITAESMSRMWDREDSILDYTYKSSESSLDREMKMYQFDQQQTLEYQKLKAESDQALGQGIFGMLKFGATIGAGAMSGGWLGVATALTGMN